VADFAIKTHALRFHCGIVLVVIPAYESEANMSVKSSNTQIRAAFMLSGLVFGGAVSAIGSVVALSVGFSDLDWETILTFMSVIVVAGSVVGAMSGAVLGDEIAGMRLRRFG